MTVLSQNGGIAAGQYLNCGDEYDLFLATVDPASLTVSNANVQTFNPTVVNFNQATQLPIAFGYTLANEQVIAHCAAQAPNATLMGQTDYVGYLITLILSNDAQAPVTSPGTPRQTIFYQIWVRDSRGAAISNSNVINGTTGVANGTWVADSTIDHFCPPTSPGCSVGQYYSMASNVNQRIYYNIDALPNINRMLSDVSAMGNNTPNCTTINNPYCMDTNPADWRVTGVYFGQALQGLTLGASQWDSLSVSIVH